MKKTVMFIAFLLVIFIIVFSPNAYADNGHYTYPITTESEDWFNYSVREKHLMLSIDKDTLEGMTDEELVYAIADFPYLIDIYVFDSLEAGLESFKETCDAYGELSKRDSFVESMVRYGSDLIALYNIEPRRDGRSAFVSSALVDIINSIINSNSQNNKSSRAADRSVPMTPNGNAVSYTTPSEPHLAPDLFHQIKDAEAVADYGITLNNSGSCWYNCHSYTWHSTSTSNIYWIINPSIYMTDGSYTQVFNSSISSAIYTCCLHVNDKVYYNAPSNNNKHSAIFIDNPNSGAPLATAYVKSKWGILGVFTHQLTNVPAGYSLNNITIWS